MRVDHLEVETTGDQEDDCSDLGNARETACTPLGGLDQHGPPCCSHARGVRNAEGGLAHAGARSRAGTGRRRHRGERTRAGTGAHRLHRGEGGAIAAGNGKFRMVQDAGGRGAHGPVPGMQPQRGPTGQTFSLARREL